MQGKVKEIRRTAGSQKPDLKFSYDGMGNRVSKTVINPTGGSDGKTKEITTYYIRDVQGNILAVYTKNVSETGDEEFYLTEQHLYGSSRIGMKVSNQLLASNVNGNVEIKEYDGYFTKEIGNKRYQLTNHLGNVLAVVSDKKLPDNEPDVVSVSDYYPFGMQMPGRLYSEPSNSYRFGFGSHEKDFEMHQGWYGFGDYGYDAMLGRRPGLDPIDQIDISNYAAFRNSPLYFTDPSGKNPTDPRTGKEISMNLYTAAVYDDYDGKVTPVLDNSLYEKAKPYNYQSRRQFNRPDGYADGGAYNTRGYNLSHLSSGAFSVLSGLFPNNKNIDVAYGTPDDYMWVNMAQQGSYVFLDNTWDESLWLHSTTTEFNIITVTENYITQIVNLNRGSSKEQYSINSITSFDVKAGDIQSRQKTTWWGGTKTEQYRVLDVTETTQNYQNNKPNGEATVKTYQTEEIVK